MLKRKLVTPGTTERVSAEKRSKTYSGKMARSHSMQLSDLNVQNLFVVSLLSILSSGESTVLCGTHTTKQHVSVMYFLSSLSYQQRVVNVSEL